MAMTGVLRPGHAQLRVLDIEESIAFYTDVLGLKAAGRDAQGRAYFKAWDEHDHASVILRQADHAGLDFFGFKVLDVATLDLLEKGLQAQGVKTERIPAGELMATGERVRFTVPTGHTLELYAHKERVGNGLGLVNPDAWPDDLKGMAVTRMDHCLLYGPDIDGTRSILEKALDFALVERVKLEDGETDLAIWLTTSTKAHDIAFVRHGEPGKLHHLAFKLDTWEQVLRAADIMSKNKVAIDIGPTRHGVTRGLTIYFFDPSGNRLETFCGGYDWYPDMDTIKWTWDEVGKGIFYHARQLNDRFLSVVS